MTDRLLQAIGDYKWVLITGVLVTVLFTAFIVIRTSEFSWDKKKIRVFAILYNLDTRGLICFTMALTRFVFIMYIVCSGGSSNIGDAVVLLILTLAYAIVSLKPSNFMQLVTYGTIYVIALMEGMFMDYYRNVDGTFTIIFLVVSFGLFAVLCNVHQFITGYEKLINECADRVIMKYRKDKSNYGDRGKDSEKETEHD